MTVLRFPRPRLCLECGEQFQARDDEAHFCTSDCRKAFNNRRAVRGAELYDLYMAHRFERQTAQEAGVFKAINRLAAKLGRAPTHQEASDEVARILREARAS